MKFDMVMSIGSTSPVYFQKVDISKVQYRIQPPFWKWKSRDMSTRVLLILMKFCMVMHILPPDNNLIKNLHMWKWMLEIKF